MYKLIVKQYMVTTKTKMTNVKLNQLIIINRYQFLTENETVFLMFSEKRSWGVV